MHFQDVRPQIPLALRLFFSRLEGEADFLQCFKLHHLPMSVSGIRAVVVVMLLFSETAQGWRVELGLDDVASIPSSPFPKGEFGCCWRVVWLSTPEIDTGILKTLSGWEYTRLHPIQVHWECRNGIRMCASL
jgi:hypothetical protein